MTNVYIVRGDGAAENYTPFFAAGGFRFAQISGLPPAANFTPTASLLSGLSVHTAVASSSNLTLPAISGSHSGTPDVLNAAHRLTRAAQTSNLWSVPTDCPQRERRGWMADAQVKSRISCLHIRGTMLADTEPL
jgi:alpha-L-rhamnosidase